MSRSLSGQLPPLDCHAHIAVDVTRQQLSALGDAVIFGMTRSLDEAHVAATRRDMRVLWGCGTHPGDETALLRFDEAKFSALVDAFILVGEIGLDRRARQMAVQQEVFEAVLRTVADRPTLLSIHSAGCAREVVDLLARYRPCGPILHWFTGDSAVIAEAAASGCFFSVNGAMSDAQIAALPVARILPETDFPVARPRTQSGALPGDTVGLERRLSMLWNEPVAAVRMRLFRNLRGLVLAAGVLDRVPEDLADHLLAV